MGLSEQEITSALLAKVSKLGQDQEDVNYGLLCGIVTEPSSATEVSDNATQCFEHGSLREKLQEFAVTQLTCCIMQCTVLGRPHTGFVCACVTVGVYVCGLWFNLYI